MTPFSSISTIGLRQRLRYRRTVIKAGRARSIIDAQSKKIRDTLKQKYFCGFILDGEASLIAAGNYPELDDLEIITHYLRMTQDDKFFGGSVLDVGAHIGFHTLYFQKFFSSVLAFEPHPLLYRILSLNVEFSQENKVLLHNCALMDYEGIGELRDHKESNMGASTLEVINETTNINLQSKKEEGFQQTKFEIPVKTCDSFNFQQRISLIKLDVEGSEESFLRGAVATLMRHYPVIVMEDWKSGMGIESDAVKFLRRLGYKSFLAPRIIPARPRRLSKFISFLRWIALDRKSVLKMESVDFAGAQRGYQLLVCVPDKSGASEIR
jgi:FkbM family methyltransferase